MFEQLFIQGLKIIPIQDGSTVEIFIPNIKREYEYIETVPCDFSGNNLEFDKAKKFTINQINSNNNRIQLVGSAVKDLYFRIIPVILDNGNYVRIQCNDEEKKNFVCVHMVQTSISWHFQPYALVRKGLRKIDNFASLEITSSKEVGTGDLYYKIVGEPIQYPIPGFTNRIVMVFNKKINSKPLEFLNIEIGVSSIAKKKYRIQKI